MRTLNLTIYLYSPINTSVLNLLYFFNNFSHNVLSEKNIYIHKRANLLRCFALEPKVVSTPHVC